MYAYGRVSADIDMHYGHGNVAFVEFDSACVCVRLESEHSAYCEHYGQSIFLDIVDFEHFQNPFLIFDVLILAYVYAFYVSNSVFSVKIFRFWFFMQDGTVQA